MNFTMEPLYPVPAVPPKPLSIRIGKLMALMFLAAVAAGVASAQSLSIVSGEGQVAAQNFQLPGPLVVVAKDASGRPVAGVPVNWSVSGPGDIVGGSQTVT